MCPIFEVVLVALSGGSWGCLGEVWMGVSERFADGSFLRGWQVLFRFGDECLLG
jgi:hypothetical protein